MGEVTTVHYGITRGLSYGTLCGRGNDSSTSGREVTCKICRKLRKLKPLTGVEKKKLEKAWDLQS
jgi:hypothetical protein